MDFTNHLPQITNVHFHGLGVSPQGHGDDSMRMIGPGESWNYVIPMPKDHSPGVYWFHTHGHDFAERQVMGGFSGTLVIEGFQDEVPATKPLVEQLMALKEFSPSSGGKLNNVPKPVNGTIKTVNGQVDPTVAMQPGETQLWRFSGQTANGYFRMRADGLKLTVIGREARPLLTPERTDEVLLGPSERVDVLVTAGTAGRYTLMQEKTSTGPNGDMFPAQLLVEVLVARDPSRPAPAPLEALTVNAPKQRPIAAASVIKQRLVVFSKDVVTGLFFINHHQVFDPERTDIKVPLGSIEEWTVRNASEELHAFHIHQLPFQVVSINGKPQPFVGLRDTIDVPIHGEVKIRLAFTHPLILGEPSEMIGVEKLHVFGNERYGWQQITVSAFLVDRTFLHRSFPFDEGQIRYKERGVGNTHLPENVMVTYHVLNMPVGHGAQASFQASAIRWAKSYRDERGEFWTTLGGDIAIPLSGSVRSTLQRRYSQLHFYVEAARRANFEGTVGRARNYVSGSAELLRGPWVTDLTATWRSTTEAVMPTQEDTIYTGTLGYNLPSQSLVSLSVARERVGDRAGVYAGLRLTQTLTTCSRCQTRGRAY